MYLKIIRAAIFIILINLFSYDANAGPTCKRNNCKAWGKAYVHAKQNESCIDRGIRNSSIDRRVKRWAKRIGELEEIKKTRSLTSAEFRELRRLRRNIDSLAPPRTDPSRRRRYYDEAGKIERAAQEKEQNRRTADQANRQISGSPPPCESPGAPKAPNVVLRRNCSIPSC